MKEKKPLTHEITEDVALKIKKIIGGNYQQAALGTIDDTGIPMVTKVIPMNYNDTIYLLISDLSEHTKNINKNHKVSLYYSLKELNKTKSNNPRLTINGIVKKNVFKKDDKEFIDLLRAYAKIESGSKMWGMFTDFNFYTLDPHRALYVEGFGKAYQINYKNDK